MEIHYVFLLSFTQVSENRMALVIISLSLIWEVGKCLLQEWILRQMTPSVRSQEPCKMVLTVTQWSCTIKSETRSNSLLSLVVLKALYISWFITERLEWTPFHFQVLNTENVITRNVLVNNNLLVLVVFINNFWSCKISHSNIICEQLISQVQGLVMTSWKPPFVGLTLMMACTEMGCCW